VYRFVPYEPFSNIASKSYILVGVGASIAPGMVGAEGSVGLVFPLSKGAETGAFASGGIPIGANVSGDVFVGFIQGELSGDTLNHNVGLLFLSITIFTADDHPVGFTIGVGPSAFPAGYSLAAARTSVFLYTPQEEIPWPPLVP
jgi:hypothetical protein